MACSFVCRVDLGGSRASTCVCPLKVFKASERLIKWDDGMAGCEEGRKDRKRRQLWKSKAAALVGFSVKAHGPEMRHR